MGGIGYFVCSRSFFPVQLSAHVLRFEFVRSVCRLESFTLALLNGIPHFEQTCQHPEAGSISWYTWLHMALVMP